MYDQAGYFYFFDVIYYYKRIYKNFDMEFHVHDYLEFMYVNFGEIVVTYRESADAPWRKTKVSTGEFVVIDGGVVHKITVGDKETQIFNMELNYSSPVEPLCLSIKTLIDNDRNFKAMIAEKERLMVLSDHYNLGAQFSHLIEYLASMEDIWNAAGSYRTTYVDFSLAAIFLQIAHNYVAQNAVQSFTGIKYLRKATKYIAENYAHGITAKKTADAAGVTQNYLNKLFSDEFSMTINEYINQFKVIKAKMLLEKTNIPISEIAAQVGYNNKQNFNKNFSRHIGMSPRAYKKFLQQKMDVHWTD